MDPNSAITAIKGIGEKTADSFAKLGVYTISDILLHFPRTYIQFPLLKDADNFCADKEGSYAIFAQVKRTPVVKNTKRMQVTLLTIGNPPIQLIWYRMPYIKNTLIPGKYYVFYGKVQFKDRGFVMEQPAVYQQKDYEDMQGRFLPVYGLTAGVTNRLMIKTMQKLFMEKSLFQEFLPEDILCANQLCGEDFARRQIHFPDTMDTLVTARRRLVFDEFFLFILGLQYQKQNREKQRNEFLFREPAYVDRMIARLPFALTEGQKNALNDICNNMTSAYVMQRLIQGDVGSGKTIVAFLAMAWTSYNGYQSAIMAPTEVLARQHFESFSRMCVEYSLDIPLILLTGSMTVRQKKLAYQRMEEEKNALIIGTHALIQEKALYTNLALVITDEQHRFGVHQRESFSDKGHMPHILVMSATPIPRTLAIILYGDLDISVIRELPAKRLPIKNCVVPTGYRPKAYQFIAEQVHMGHQAYVICPLVEASENMEGENVLDYAKKIREQLPENISIGTLHGKMKSDQKNQIMEAFAKVDIQVLISTTVVEVGVNVPNATVMMIENADHFGLAQLHQLRGRVGRGDSQSYCIMINTSDSKQAQKRLEILNRSNDGFFIAGEDLKLRGPGDFFGIRQSGELAFHIADIYQDADVLQAASASVNELLRLDPSLSMECHSGIRNHLDIYRKEQLSKLNL